MRQVLALVARAPAAERAIARVMGEAHRAQPIAHAPAPAGVQEGEVIRGGGGAVGVGQVIGAELDLGEVGDAADVAVSVARLVARGVLDALEQPLARARRPRGLVDALGAVGLAHRPAAAAAPRVVAPKVFPARGVGAARGTGGGARVDRGAERGASEERRAVDADLVALGAGQRFAAAAGGARDAGEGGEAPAGASLHARVAEGGIRGGVREPGGWGDTVVVRELEVDGVREVARRADVAAAAGGGRARQAVVGRLRSFGRRARGGGEGGEERGGEEGRCFDIPGVDGTAHRSQIESDQRTLLCQSIAPLDTARRTQARGARFLHKERGGRSSRARGLF